MKAQTSSISLHPFTMLILVGEADIRTPTVVRAREQRKLLTLAELPEDTSLEYMARILGIPRSMLPTPVSDFIAMVSQGNPLYMRETMSKLLMLHHIIVHRDVDGRPDRVEYMADLDKVEIAKWRSTAMVGQLECLLESLDPLEAAVLKMSTAFKGIFTLSDLAASSCSQWAGSTHFDSLRLLRAIQHLVKGGLLEVERESFSYDYEDSSDCTPTRELQAYKLTNVLIRKVGGSMLLEAQRRVVKRQALIDRVLSNDLPQRLEEHARRNQSGHIPWYYEDVLLRPSEAGGRLQKSKRGQSTTNLNK